MGKQLPDRLLHLREFLDERLTVHSSCNITIFACGTMAKNLSLFGLSRRKLTDVNFPLTR
jgi:hypothetical protein